MKLRDVYVLLTIIVIFTFSITFFTVQSSTEEKCRQECSSILKEYNRYWENTLKEAVEKRDIIYQRSLDLTVLTLKEQCALKLKQEAEKAKEDCQECFKDGYNKAYVEYWQKNPPPPPEGIAGGQGQGQGGGQDGNNGDNGGDDDGDGDDDGGPGPGPDPTPK